MTKVKKQIRPKVVKSAPIPDSFDKLEFMSATYPIGFGFSERGNLLMFVHDHSVEGEAPVVLEHLIAVKELEKIIEIAHETLDNLGRHLMGVKVR